MLAKTVYYLTGMGGRLDTGLGQGLLSRGITIVGRELVDEFRRLDFQQQIDLVADDLNNKFWSDDSYVIANSFGAYIFLHAQAQLPQYVGNVMLLSPIVGEFGNEDTQMNFIPPRADKLMELAEAGSYPVPLNCQIHVGEEDWQSNPKNVTTFGRMLGIDVNVVPKAGHMLPVPYVSDLLDKWLG